MLMADNTVRYGTIGEAADTFQCALTCKVPMSDAVALLHEAIVGAGLCVLHEIDPQALLKRGGFAIGQARQILFFHPRFMVRILAADPAALLEAPLKFALLEKAGGRVLLRWTDPALAFARYENSQLADLGLELSALCEEIVTAAFGSSSGNPGETP
jgi:uncharacterized protein (DUF302 family)